MLCSATHFIQLVIFAFNYSLFSYTIILRPYSNFPTGPKCPLELVWPYRCSVQDHTLYMVFKTLKSLLFKHSSFFLLLKKLLVLKKPGRGSCRLCYLLYFLVGSWWCHLSCPSTAYVISKEKLDRFKIKI